MKNALQIIVTIFPLLAMSQGPIDGFYRGSKGVTTVLSYGYENNNKYLIGTTESSLERTLEYGNVYAAYGITKNLDVQLSLPYMESGSNKSLQDISAYLKHRIGSKRIRSGDLEFSLGLGFSTPMNDYEVGDLNDLGQRATVLDSRVLIHYKWESNWFVTMQSGFSYKFKEVPNSIPFIAKVGRAVDKWYYAVFYDFQNAYNGIDYRGTPAPQNFRELEVDYQKVGATIYRKIKGSLGLYINYSNVFDGRNTFQGSRYSLGIVCDFRL